MSSVSDAGGSGSEELQKCPPPSPVVLYFVSGRERKPRQKKKKEIFYAYPVFCNLPWCIFQTVNYESDSDNEANVGCKSGAATDSKGGGLVDVEDIGVVMNNQHDKLKVIIINPLTANVSILSRPLNCFSKKIN